MRDLLQPQTKDPQRLFGQLERELVYYRDRKRCAVCDSEVAWSDAEIYHVDHHVLGGRAVPDNGALVHRECHPKRAAVEAFAKRWRESVRASSDEAQNQVYYCRMKTWTAMGNRRECVPVAAQRSAACRSLTIGERAKPFTLAFLRARTTVFQLCLNRIVAIAERPKPRKRERAGVRLHATPCRPFEAAPSQTTQTQGRGGMEARRRRRRTILRATTCGLASTSLPQTLITTQPIV
jgi:HNH endonuclease